MDHQRAGTSHSQQGFIPMHVLEHSAPEVVNHHVDEKYQSPPPSRHGSIHPTAAVQKQPTFFPSEFETIPPQYAGTPAAAYPAALVAPPIEETQRDEERYCGIRRRKFLLLLVIGGVVLLVLAIAIGVGVGVSAHKSDPGAAAAAAAAGASSSSTSSGTGVPTKGTPTSTSTSPSPTTDGGACEFDNNTQFTAANGKAFLRLCGFDYSGANEATDIGDVPTSTFEKCIETCAKDEECTGAGWAPPSSDEKYSGICWMKKDLKKSHVATENWHFAVLLAGGGSSGTTTAASSATTTTSKSTTTSTATATSTR